MKLTLKAKDSYAVKMCKKDVFVNTKFPAGTEFWYYSKLTRKYIKTKLVLPTNAGDTRVVVESETDPNNDFYIMSKRRLLAKVNHGDLSDARIVGVLEAVYGT